MSKVQAIDSLDGYTQEMFSVLLSGLSEEERVHFPSTRRLFGEVKLDGDTAIVKCLTRHDAKVLQTRIEKVSLRLVERAGELGFCGIFSSYGLEIENHQQYELDGLEYLKRQTEHFKSHDEYLLIVAFDTQGVDGEPTN